MAKVSVNFVLGGLLIDGIPRITKLTGSGIKLEDAPGSVLGPIIVTAVLLAVPVAFYMRRALGRQGVAQWIDWNAQPATYWSK